MVTEPRGQLETDAGYCDICAVGDLGSAFSGSMSDGDSIPRREGFGRSSMG